MKASSPTPNQDHSDQSETVTVQKRAGSVPHAKLCSQNIGLILNISLNENSSTTKTGPVIERFSKLKILKQKSLIYEIFARSSSASFERQASCDSGTCFHNAHNQPQKIISRHASNLKTNSIIILSTSSLASSIISSNYHNNCYSIMNLNMSNNRLLTPFKPPPLFSLVQTKPTNSTHSTNNNNQINIVINPLIQYYNYQNNSLCSSSGVSTLKSGRSGSSTVNKISFILNRQNSTCTQCQTPINQTTLTNSISGHNNQKVGDHVSENGLFSLNSTTNTGSLMSCNDRPSRDNITNTCTLLTSKTESFLNQCYLTLT